MMLPIGLALRYERIEKEIKENLAKFGELKGDEHTQLEGKTREETLELMSEYRFQTFKIQALQGELDIFLADATRHIRETNKYEEEIQRQLEEVKSSEQGTSYWTNILQQRLNILKDIIIRLGLILNPIEIPTPYTIGQLPPCPAPGGNSITVNVPPKPEIMKFDGDETMWPLFWNLFDNYVNKSNIPDSDKLCQLVSHLEGPARKAIRGIAPIPENYGTMIRELQSIYGDNKSIIANLELTMQKLPISPSSYQWVDSVTEMLGILKQLKNLGEPLNNSKWIRDVVCRLPEFIKVEIYANPDSYQTIEEIQDFLQRRIRIEQQLKRDRARSKLGKDKPPTRSKPMAHGQINRKLKQEPSNAWPRTSALTVNTQPEKQMTSRKCCFCQVDNHFSSMCKTYPIGEKRIARAKFLRLCLKCSLPNHKTEECRSKLRGCSHCGKPHLNMLCPRPGNMNPMPSPEKLNKKVIVDNQQRKIGEEVSQAKFAQQVSKGRKDIILPSILVTVTTVPRSEKKEEVLALLDTGSQNSYILKSLAKRLQLPLGIPERFKVETFNEKRPRTINTEKVEFALYEEGAGKFFMDAYTVDFISSEIQTVNMRSKPTTFGIEDLTEDDFIRLKPSILIGADYCYQIIGDPRDQSETVRRWNTPLGPVITGCWDKTSKSLWAIESTEEDNLFDWNRYSNIWRVVRTAKMVIRAKNKWLHVDRLVTLQEAMELVIREGQKGITEKEKLDHNLYLDVKDIWRLGSRVKEYRKPVHIYIPPESPILELLILDAHERCAHFGVEHTMATFREDYWTEQARQRIKKTIERKCQHCKRWRAKQFQLPPMANLPMERTTPCVPFKTTAVDYLGPIQVKGEWTIRKKWICLFTCLTTRAVHLEVADGLSLANFIIIYKQFVARRGEPQTMISDFGTQFVAAAQILKPRWKFGTPQAPWQGGVYERLIGLTKIAIKKTVGRRLLSEDELRLLITEIESILNHRPLTYQGDDLNNVLRPVDFLRPSAHGVIDEVGNQASRLISIKNRMEECLNQLWKLWSSYYLNSLRERKNRDILQPKATTKRQPKINEIVIVKEPNVPRGMWKLARITKLIPSSDGRVRTAEIQVGTRRWLRPINLLYPLELEAEKDAEQKENNTNDATTGTTGKEDSKEDNQTHKTNTNLIKQENQSRKETTFRKTKEADNNNKTTKHPATTPLKKSLFYIMTLFTLLAPTSGVRFWACLNKNEGSMMNLPEIRNCSIPDPDGVRIQVEMYTRKYHKIPAVICTWTQREVCTKSFLHLTLEVTRDAITQRNLTKEECEILTRDKQLNGIHLHRISEDEWTSDQDTRYSYGILGTRCTTTDNYHLTLGSIATADGKGALTDLVSRTRCEISDGICITTRGTIIWNPKAGERMCPFDLRGTYKAIITDGQIIIDELQAVFDYANGSFNDERCNINDGIRVDADIVLHQPTLNYTILKRKPTGKIVKDREIILPNNGLAALIQKEIREEIPKVDPQMQYHYRQFRDELADHLIRNYQERCELSNLMIEHILQISEGNPTLAARILLQRNDVIAKNIGRGMLVTPCREVQPEKIYKTHQVNNQCYQDLPIRVGKILMFASLRTGEIKATSPKMKCDVLRRVHYDENGQPTNLLWRTRTYIDRRNFTLKNLQFTSQTLVDLEKQRVQLELEALAGATSQQLIVRHDDVREHFQKTSETEEMIQQLDYDVEEGVSVAGRTIKDELYRIAMTWILRIGIVGILIFIIILTVIELKHQILRKLCSFCNLSNLFKTKRNSEPIVQFTKEPEPLVQFRINPEPLVESGSSSRECHKSE